MNSSPQAVTVVHMGDSITYGQYLAPTFRWTTLIAIRLAERFPELALSTIPRGISGETTRLGLERFPHDVQAAEPDVMTLQFGLNDCNGWKTDRGLPRVSERAFTANMVEMIERARRFGAREVIVQTNHPTLRRGPLPSGELYEDANSRYSELIREIAEETGATLCDIREEFARLAEDELARMLLPAPDLLHLSAEGNELYADVIYPFVEEAVGRVAATSTELREA